MRACTFDIRVTTDAAIASKGMHLFFPFGYFTSYSHKHQRLEIPLSYDLSLRIEPEARPGWAFVFDQSLQCLYKFPTPTEVSADYHTYTFYSYGKTYILEIRIESFMEAEGEVE